jgi:hypothetical protein
LVLRFLLLLEGCGPKPEPNLQDVLPCRGFIDSVAFEPLSRALEVKGWVFSPNDPILRLVILLDGRPWQATPPNLEQRPDVAVALGDSRAAESGWTFSLLVPPDAAAKTYNVNIVVELASGRKIKLPSVAPKGCEVLIPVVSQPMPKTDKPAEKNQDKDSSKKQT